MAKKFQYKLQSVLRYREMLEGDAKRIFARANQAVEEQKAKERSLQEERLGLQDDLREISQGGEIPFSQLVNTLKYIGGLEMGIASVQREAERLRREAEVSRLAFITIRRDRRALEILKEKRYKDYLKEEDRQQQLTLDELSLRSLRRREEEKRQREAFLKEKLLREADPFRGLSGGREMDDSVVTEEGTDG